MRNNLIIFMTGAAVGYIAAYLYQEWRYKHIVEEFDDEFEEEEEVINQINSEELPRYSQLYNKPSILGIDLSNEKMTYYNIAKKENYIQEEKEEIEEEIMETPYIIEQDEFRKGPYADHEHVTMYYYKDGILADLDNPDFPIAEPEVIEMLVGTCLEDADEYEPDEWIYIRNRASATDYEIQIKDHDFSEREDE